MIASHDTAARAPDARSRALISEQARGPRVIDLSQPWPAGASPWERARREADEKSEALAAHAERLLGQADATSALAGIGYAALALRAELESQELRRDR